MGETAPDTPGGGHPRVAAAVAVAAWGLVLVAAALLLAARPRVDEALLFLLVDVTVAAVYGTVAATILSRRGHVVGWLLALAAVGGFDERFRAAWREDSDLLFTLLERGGRVVPIPAAIVVHPVRTARYEPREGRYIVFSRGTGGNEQDQLYRLDLPGRQVTLLTDPAERHSLQGWLHGGGRLLALATPLDRTAAGGSRTTPSSPASSTRQRPSGTPEKV